MDIPTPDELRVVSERTRENNIRNRIVGALEAALSESSLIITVKAPHSAAIDAALVARGYTTVTHDGTDWSIGWDGAVDVAEDINSPYKKAIYLLAMTSKSGELYFCDAVREALQTAVAIGETTINVECEHMSSMQTQLESLGYTVTHDGATWTISW